MRTWVMNHSKTVDLPIKRNINGYDLLTHWGREMHIHVSKLTIIGSDNGLSLGQHQAIIWNNAGILSTGPLGTNLSEILIKVHTFSFKKMHLKITSGKWRPFCLGFKVLTKIDAKPLPKSIRVSGPWVSIQVGNDLACNRRQAITQINDDQDLWYLTRVISDC